jgi:imidazolonepropionase-like amidohydrolase
MSLRIGLVALGLVVGLESVGAGAQQVAVLRDVRLIDGTGALPREHVSLLLRDGRIAAIGGPEVSAPRGGTVRDMVGKTVMPGLISAHSHLGLLVGDAENSATGIRGRMLRRS